MTLYVAIIIIWIPFNYLSALPAIISFFFALICTNQSAIFWLKNNSQEIDYFVYCVFLLLPMCNFDVCPHFKLMKAEILSASRLNCILIKAIFLFFKISLCSIVLPFFPPLQIQLFSVENVRKHLLCNVLCAPRGSRLCLLSAHSAYSR